MGTQSADIPNPADDLFYRETLKALNSHLARAGAADLEQNRLTHKLCDAVDQLTHVTKRHAAVAEQQLEVLREIKDALRAEAPRRARPESKAPVLAIPRTKTGG